MKRDYLIAVLLSVACIALIFGFGDAEDRMFVSGMCFILFLLVIGTVIERRENKPDN